MTESKSSGQCQKVLMALLTLWFVGSLITIVVWSTAPDFKSAAQCRAELKDLTVQHEGSKVVCQKNQEALEQMVHDEREKQERLRAAILAANERLNATNATLEECRQDNMVLMTNISALQEMVDALQQIQTNLTTQLVLKEDQIDALQLNLTQAEHQTEACFSLRDAAQAQTKAAESQLRACQSTQDYLQKQLQKCKVSEAEAAKQTTPQQTGSKPTGSGPGLRVLPGLVLVLTGLSLFT